MAKIIVGQEYAKEFESICALYGGGFLSSDVHIKKAHGSVIQTPTHTFEFREKEHGVNGSGENEEQTLAFNKDGASWFSALRGEKFDSGNADWKQLIMDVAADYHKHYSLIEFRHTASKASYAEERRLRDRFKTGFIDRVFPDGASFTVAENRRTAPENYYAVSMRLEINGGGESAPVLGKLYFRDGGDGKLTPVSAREAERVQVFIESAVPAENDVETAGFIDVALVGKVFSGLEKTFRGGKFADYAAFNGKYKREIKNLLAQLATSEIKSLECTNVKVLGISHVEWERSVYDVYYRGRNVLELTAGVNGTVSLTCSNCGENALLVDGNRVVFKDGDADVELNFERDDLGLTPQHIAQIRESGEINDHLFTVACKENPRNRDCTRVVCASQAINVAVGKNSDGSEIYERKCRGCRYPEIIFTDIFSDGDGVGKYTPRLQFAADTLSLVDVPTVRCRCCGREFTVSAMPANKICHFCARDDKSSTAKKLYRKYAGMLSLGVRLAHLFAKKYCREEDNVILFELGRDCYVFDKLNFKEHGFIKKPEKVVRGVLR